MIAKRALVRIAALSIATLGLGCAFGEIYWDDPLKREVALREAQKRYSDLIRWNEYERASVYVPPAERPAFMERLPDFRDMRFTDYESSPIEPNDDMTEAKVIVTYRGYRMSSPIEEPVEEIQDWYRSSVTNNWMVHSSFATDVAAGDDAAPPAAIE